MEATVEELDQRRLFSLTINPTFDPSVTSQQQAAFNYAATEYASLFANTPGSVTVNIDVVAAPGVGLGESSGEPLYSVSYSTLRTKLLANSPGLSLPTTDPISTSHIWAVTSAEEKALGLLGATSTSDGTFTFDSGVTYTYDPNHRAVSGAYDFIGVAEHEISEIMGRVAILGTWTSGGTPLYGPYDLFRFTGSGVPSLSPTDTNVYFSVDNGATNLKGFNSGSGDLGDWASGSNDSYNATSYDSVVNDVSWVDATAMGALGYTPVPATVSLSSGVLTVTGSTAADDVAFSVSGTTLTVTFNGTSSTFSTTSISSIVVNAGDGADAVTAAGISIPVSFNGGDGNDTLTGGNGNDTLTGGAGDDVLAGRDGNDTFVDGSGTNVFDGGNGNDTADYTAWSTPVLIELDTAVGVLAGGGTAEYDYLPGIETILGGSGDDSITALDSTGNYAYTLPLAIYGNGGNDALTGGNGNDTLNGGTGDDVLTGGAGNDTADYSDRTVPLTIALDPASGLFTGGASGENDSLSGIDTFLGGSGNDSIKATVGTTSAARPLAIFGNGGNDTLSGGAGNDTLQGNDGDDLFIGTYGTDTFDGGIGSNRADFSTLANSSYTVTVTAANATSTATIYTSAGASTGYSVSFNNVTDITGTAGVDSFIMTATSIDFTIHGGGGADTATFATLPAGYTLALVAGNTSSAAQLYNSGSYTGRTSTFFGVYDFTATAGNDSFNLSAATGAAFAIHAGLGSNSATYATMLAGYAITLTAGNASSAAQVYSGGSYTGYSTTFYGVTNFTGTPGADTFNMSAATTTNFVVTGGGGSDAATYATLPAGYTISVGVGNTSTVYLNNGGTYTGYSSTFVNVRDFTGTAGNDYFNMASATAANFVIHAGGGYNWATYASATSGYTIVFGAGNSSSTASIYSGGSPTGFSTTFFGVNDVTGTTGNDYFNMSGATTANFTITGAGGYNWVTYSSMPAGYTISLTAGNSSSSVYVNGGGGSSTFNGINDFTGTTGNDYFDMSAATAASFVITGGGGTYDRATYASAAAGYSISLGAGNTSTAYLNYSGTYTGYSSTFVNITEYTGTAQDDYFNMANTTNSNLVLIGGGSVTGTGDQMDYSAIAGGYTVSLGLGTTSSTAYLNYNGSSTAYATTFRDMYTVICTGGNDYVNANNGPADGLVIYGGAGSDYIDFSSAPAYYAWAELFSNEQFVELLPLSGTGSIPAYSLFDFDTLSLTPNNDQVVLGSPVPSAPMTIYGNNGADSITGGNGADTIYGGAGNDTIHGGGGADAIYGDNGADSLYGDNGNDTITGGAGADYMDGGNNDDLFYALDSGTKDTIRGQAGNDVIGNKDAIDDVIL